MSVSGSNNELLTSDGSGGIVSESLITFDGAKLSLLYQSGDEGGEILLNKSVTNNTLDGVGITIDSYRNKIRFFEQGGSARGAYIDLTECSAGVGTNLLSGVGGSGTSGTSGVNGSSGTSGVNGANGSSGTSGVSGANGSSGTSGVSGANGSSGTSGVNGANGNDGSSGTSGVSGANGSSGTSGVNGSSGTSGVSGSNGIDSASFEYYYSTSTTGSDPGSGYFRLNNLTMGSATLLYIDQFDKGGNNNLQGFLNSLSNYGSTSRRGFIKITKQNDLTWFQTYEFSTTQDNTGWWTITLSNVISDANFTNNDLCFVSFNVSGPNGSSGTSGINGANGSSGTSGVNGANGSSGTSGVNGANGSSGTSGVNGANGSSGTSGVNGGNGSSGTSGVNGVNGANGSSGTSGVSGANGNDGSSGTFGSSGTSGVSGANGNDGSSGTSGVNGTSGTTGTSGLLTLTGTTDNGVITLNGSQPNGNVETNLTFDGSQLNVTGSTRISGTFSGTTSNYVTADFITQTVLLYLSNNT